MKTFPLEDGPSYVAVSYRWGEANVGYPFLCLNKYSLLYRSNVWFSSPVYMKTQGVDTRHE